MGLKHRISIKVARPSGETEPVIESATARVRRKLLNFLLGEQVNVLVVSPGSSVQTVEIHELKGGDTV